MIVELKKEESVKAHISNCQGLDHVQQVAFSTYHGALTQICFTCHKVRTSMPEEDLNDGNQKGDEQ